MTSNILNHFTVPSSHTHNSTRALAHANCPLAGTFMRTSNFLSFLKKKMELFRVLDSTSYIATFSHGKAQWWPHTSWLSCSCFCLSASSSSSLASYKGKACFSAMVTKAVSATPPRRPPRPPWGQGGGERKTQG